MKNLKTVFLFELKTLVKKKPYIITTTLLFLVALIATSIPTIFGLFEEGTEDGAGENQKAYYGVFVEEENFDMAKLEAKLESPDLAYYSSMDALKTALEEEDIMDGYHLKTATSYTLLVNNVSMFQGESSFINSALQSYAEDVMLEDEGLNPEAYRQIIGQVFVEREIEILGKNVQNSYWVVYFLVIITFLIIMIYGNGVATYVAREKSDRTMEILITSSNPKSLIIGKVFASGSAGILQFLVVGLALITGYLLNRGNYSPAITEFLNLSLSPELLLVYGIFALTGYFLFLFIYAALGALVSKVEDVPSATTLVTMFAMIAYFIALFSLNMTDSVFLSIASYFPFTSFMVMFVRYAIANVSFFKVSISYGILFITTILMALASVKIYRFGTLNYGNTTNVFKLARKAFKAKE